LGLGGAESAGALDRPNDLVGFAAGFGGGLEEQFLTPTHRDQLVAGLPFECFDLFAAGDTAGARLVNARMLPSFAFETGDDAPNPLPTKAMLRHLGIPVGQARLPMGPAPEFVERRAPEVWADLQRWRDAFPQRPL
jgi:hypothetical protein